MFARTKVRMAAVPCSAIALMFSGLSAAQAHNWVPADGNSSGYTSHQGCDGPDSEPDWPFNDGRVCYTHWYYDHVDHMHYDHLKYYFNSDNLGMSDTVVSITNQRIRIFPGNCDNAPAGHQTFPDCYTMGYVDPPVYDSSLPDNTSPATVYTHDVGSAVGRIDRSHMLVVVDYTANGWLHINSQPTPVWESYTGQEESHL